MRSSGRVHTTFPAIGIINMRHLLFRKNKGYIQQLLTYWGATGEHRMHLYLKFCRSYTIIGYWCFFAIASGIIPTFIM